MHPLEFTADGLGMATQPFLILDLEVSDDILQQSIREAFQFSKKDVPYRPVTKEEEKAYLTAMKIKAPRELGRGVDVVLEDKCYNITPIDKKGMFGEPITVDATQLLYKIREYLEILPAKI